MRIKAVAAVLVLISSNSLAVAVPLGGTPPPETSIWMPIVSAAIGAVAAIITPFFASLIIPRFVERRGKKASEREVFRSYLAPLAAAAQKLIWRYNEIFVDGRHQWLRMASRPVDYNEYKRTSTLYRIATFLGWIRALNIELSALSLSEVDKSSSVYRAIEDAQKALADGPHVEAHRLKQVCAVWRIDLSNISQERLEKLAASLEVKFYTSAQMDERDDRAFLSNLDAETKFQLCRLLCGYICSELKRAPASDAVVGETVSAACDALSYREAWIYRDWQDAIGDAVLEPDPDSPRRYKIVGYEKFVSLLKGSSPWFEALKKCISDVDFEYIDPNDFRRLQMENFAKAVARLALAISSGQNDDLIGKSSKDVANKILKFA